MVASVFKRVTRVVDKFVIDEVAAILLEVKPDLVLLALFTIWDAEPLSWSDKDVHKALIREVVRGETVSPTKNVSLKTKDCKSCSEVDKCFREL